MPAVAPLEQLDDVALLIKAHHALIFLETLDEQRASKLLEHLADRHRMPFFCWTEHKGLVRHKVGQKAIYGTSDPVQALEHLLNSDIEAIYYFQDFLTHANRSEVISRIKEVHQRFARHRAALILTGSHLELPPALAHLFTRVELRPPSEEEYHQYLNVLLSDLRSRMPIAVALDEQGVRKLLRALRGLSLLEVQKVITKVVVMTQRFDGNTLAEVLKAKEETIERSGVLDFFPTQTKLDDVVGLGALKRWLRQRSAVFSDSTRAHQFGLSAPKGILLFGVQGCGKSLCAKAVAAEWGLPLVRLDPSNLYQKYVGESEKNLNRAIATAEAMAPIVLWIDEIEKAFGHSQGQDGGVSSRIFGTLLSWMQEKEAEVFVIATSNNISELPPELMRKGRFDEIFFIDLPSGESRRQILELHIRRRGHSADILDLEALSRLTDGFSGAELEQAVVSALYAAFSEHRALTQDDLEAEIGLTRPLSVTMSEKVQALRSWAQGRAVFAE
ncbi:MAG: AAA family ATPase [Myxococcales bacterium]|nr:AAA family ATPase [Myxococcales bacterium]